MRRLCFGLFFVAGLSFGGAPVGAQVPGACGHLPLPPQLAGKQVVLAIPANKSETKPCAAGTVVAYTLVDGQQMFLPVAIVVASAPVAGDGEAREHTELVAAYKAGNLAAIRARAQAGSPVAQSLMANLHFAGLAVPKRDKQPKATREDEEEGIRWLNRAADQGHSGSRLMRAMYALSGKFGQKDCKLAIGEFDALIDGGMVQAMMQRGHASRFGYCTRQDYSLARQLFGRAIERGNDYERSVAQSWLTSMGNQGLPKSNGVGGGFLDTLVQAAPVVIGAFNEATADIAAQRQAEAAQQARANQQYQSAMAAAQARRRQAGAEGAAVAAARDASNATTQQARQDALNRQRAALAQASEAAAVTARPAQPTPTRADTITGAAPREIAAGGRVTAGGGAIGVRKGYFPEKVSVCEDAESSTGGMIARCRNLNDSLYTDVASDRVHLDRISGQCEGRLLKTGWLGSSREIGYRVYGCGYPDKARINMSRELSLNDLGLGPIPGRRVYECPTETTCDERSGR